MVEMPRPATGIVPEDLVRQFESDDTRGFSPDVGVIMGSDSDLPMMMSAVQVLRDFRVPFETRIVSAHRTPEWMSYYGHLSVVRGLKVIIAGAGGSAHLPGDMASHTRLPVIGVAIDKDNDPLNAAIGSMIEMPPDGGPTATAGKNKASAVNAGLLAVRMLALGDNELAAKVEARMTRKAAEVLDKDWKLQEIGVDAYLEQMGS